MSITIIPMPNIDKIKYINDNIGQVYVHINKGPRTGSIGLIKHKIYIPNHYYGDLRYKRVVVTITGRRDCTYYVRDIDVLSGQYNTEFCEKVKQNTNQVSEVFDFFGQKLQVNSLVLFQRNNGFIIGNIVEIQNDGVISITPLHDGKHKLNLKNTKIRDTSKVAILNSKTPEFVLKMKLRS